MSAETCSLKVACERLGVPYRTARGIIARHPDDPRLHPTIPIVRIGGRWKVPVRPLDRLLEADEVPA